MTRFLLLESCEHAIEPKPNGQRMLFNSRRKLEQYCEDVGLKYEYLSNIEIGNFYSEYEALVIELPESF